MLEYEVIDARQTDVMVYGLDLLFSSIVSLASFVLLGFCLGRERETFWLLITFIPLQSFGGGYHCQTHFRCWLLMLVGYFIAMYIIIKIPAILLWGGAMLGAYSFMKLAPIENPNALLGDVFRKKMRRIVVCIYWTTLLLAGIIQGVEQNYYAVILAAVILSASSILGAYTKNKLVK